MRAIEGRLNRITWLLSCKPIPGSTTVLMDAHAASPFQASLLLPLAYARASMGYTWGAVTGCSKRRRAHWGPKWSLSFGKDEAAPASLLGLSPHGRPSKPYNWS